jgi:hypothetical protein
MQTLRLTIVPARESNDHQVRPVVDDEDLIGRRWPDMVGLDPDAILLDLERLLGTGGARRPVTIARCSCGEVGCGSQELEIARQEGSVVWRLGGETLRFDAPAYDAEVRRAAADTSWETADRTAGRLVREEVTRRKLDARLRKAGMRFEWASGRVQPHVLTASLQLTGDREEHVLVHVPWREQEPPAVIAASLVALLARPPAEWQAEIWLQRSAPLPPMAGPGWRRKDF